MQQGLGRTEKSLKSLAFSLHGEEGSRERGGRNEDWDRWIDTSQMCSARLEMAAGAPRGRGARGVCDKPQESICHGAGFLREGEGLSISDSTVGA